MAYTTAKAFDVFLELIEPTSTQFEAIKTRRGNAAKVLRTAFPGTSTLPFGQMKAMGSTSRRTVTRPVNDLDVLAIFKNKDGIFEKYRRDSQAFLYRVRDGINAKTQVRQVGARGQAVRLFYKDGLHVDIAPVFAWDQGGFILPAGDGTWQRTNPPAQKDWIDERHRILNYHLKPRVKLLKRWNAAHSHRIGSWHLEVMTASIFSSMSANHRDGLERFFEWAPSRIDVNDPDDCGGLLAAGLTSAQRTQIRDSFASALARCQRANTAEADGDHREAIRLWTIILGSDFPAYGA